MLNLHHKFMTLYSICGRRMCILFFLVTAATAQVQSPPPAAKAPPVPYASVSQLNLMLSQLEQVSQSTQTDLAKLRIEKWKTDSNTKRGTQLDVESIQRNLQMALPEIVAQLRTSPENIATTFKLYHNLDALYDVFGPVVESAGAFGPKDEFQSLENDFTALERSRRDLAERMESLAGAKEGELAQLRGQVRQLQAAAAPPAPAKKVVVDDTQPEKKPVKKKSAKTHTPATTQKSGSSTTSQPSTQQTQTQPQP